jgi:hypothetical protein
MEPEFVVEAMSGTGSLKEQAGTDADLVKPSHGLSLH